SVEQRRLVGHVVVQGHRFDVEPLGERAHRERRDPVDVSDLDRRREHAFPAQRGPSLRARARRHAVTPVGLRPGPPYLTPYGTAIGRNGPTAIGRNGTYRGSSTPVSAARAESKP